MTIGLCFFCSICCISRNALVTIEDCNHYFNKVSHERNSLDSNLLFAQQAMECYKELEQWEGYTRSLGQFAALYYYNEELGKSLQYARKALDIATEYLTEESTAYARAVNNMAVLSEKQGNYNRAILLHKRSIELREKQNAPKARLANSHHNLGMTYQVTGDHDEAIRYLEYALILRQDTLPAFSNDIASNYAQLALSFKKKKQWNTALNLYHKGLHALSGNPNRDGAFLKQTAYFCYQNMADIYLQKAALDSSLYFIQKAENIQSEFQVFEDYKSHLILAEINVAKGNYTEALGYLNQSLTAARNEHAPVKKHGDIAEVLKRIAEVKHILGNWEESVSYYIEAQQAIGVDFDEERIEKNPEPNDYLDPMQGLDILISKARTMYELFQTRNDTMLLSASFETYRAASSLLRSIQQRHLTLGAKQLLSEKAKEIYEPALEVAMHLHKLKGGEQYLEQAFYLTEDGKAGILRQEILDRRAKSSSGIPDSLLEQEKNIKIETAYTQTLLNEMRVKGNEHDQIKQERLKKELFDLMEKERTLSMYLEENYEEYRQQRKQFQSSPINTIQDELKTKGNTVIEYYVGIQAFYVFYISDEQFLGWRIERERAFERHLKELLDIIQNPPKSASFNDGFSRFVKSSEYLYNTLMALPMQHISRNVHRLTIIPDNLLHDLPFEILLTPNIAEHIESGMYAKLPFVIKDYAISYQYSASMLIDKEDAGNKDEQKKAFVGFAPEFNSEQIDSNRDCIADRMYSLLCNQKEVLQISELMAGEALLASAANKARFVEAINDSRIVHLATHACLDADNHQFNKIYFSDGALSSLDLGNHNIKAELAVLSACNTAKGTLVEGEGTMSLSREFTLAGCASTIMSLWSIDDCSASDLLGSFYVYLKKGFTKDIALQQAKIGYLNSSDKAGAHPYYWSAFVHSGESKVLFPGQRYWWIPVLLLFIIFGFWTFKRHCFPFKRFTNT